jgi:hypothetical protein
MRYRVRKKTKETVAAITTDLTNPSMSYMLIALKHHVGLSLVNRVAKAAGLTRQRGPRAKV